MIRLKSIFFIALCSALSAPSALSGQNTTIKPNESLTFTASYNMSGILTELAQVVMETSEVQTSTARLLRLKCTARTFTKWDGFFKINDLYESYVSPSSLQPYLYKRDISEGGYYKFMQYKFSPSAGTASSLKRKRRKDGTFWDEKKELQLGANTRDLVSTIYHIRNLDIHKAAVGDADTFPVLFDNKEHQVTLTMLGKEEVNTVLGRVSCYKLGVSLSTSDVLRGDSDNVIWLTDDDRKIPVLIRFKIPVGNGELRLSNAKLP